MGSRTYHIDQDIHVQAVPDVMTVMRTAAVSYGEGGLARAVLEEVGWQPARSRSHSLPQKVGLRCPALPCPWPRFAQSGGHPGQGYLPAHASTSKCNIRVRASYYAHHSRPIKKVAGSLLWEF
ncbi:hypothetical protein L1887_58100 [Cichorium endivia]|nr:hypothetical protein L1887_58100 [Cichorium endivia]